MLSIAANFALGYSAAEPLDFKNDPAWDSFKQKFKKTYKDADDECEGFDI